MDKTVRMDIEESEDDICLVPVVAVAEDESARLFRECTERYRTEGLVAVGTMGTVYMVKDLPCDRTVALKLISEEGLNDQEEYRRFINEAKITARHEHPNIVPVHELGINENGSPFYTMKHVDGVPFSKIIAGLQRGDSEMVREYPLGKLLTIFQKICDAVAFAHAKGVIHCDLKPANIMVGEYGEVLVLDWGLAKYLCELEEVPDRSDEMPQYVPPDEPDEGSSGERSLNPLEYDTAKTTLRFQKKKTVTGTPAFMAPELILSLGAQFSVQSDIYALGGILYLLLTLRSHVDGADLKELLGHIVHAEITPPIAFNERASADGGPRLLHCPEERIPFILSDVALCALRREPDERFPCVRILQQEVEQYQNGRIWHPVVREDRFDESVLERWDVLGGKYELIDGTLRLYGGEPQILLLKQDVPGDIRIEFECVMNSEYLNDLACLINAIRSEDPWMTSVSGYAFKYGAYTNSFNVLTRLDNKLFSERAASLETDRRYMVRVERVGHELNMWVQHELIFSAYDPHPLSGAQHAAAGLLGWLAETRYFNVKVYALSTPTNCNILDLADRHLEHRRYSTARDLFSDAMHACTEMDEDQRRRASEGYLAATRCEEMLKRLPEWKAGLQAAWPEASIALLVERHGLTLDITGGQIVDLSPAAHLPVTHLQCAMNRLETLEPCRAMPLEVLICSGNPISSLEPISGKTLNTILCENCAIDSLEPIRGMPLQVLNCSWNPIEGGLEPVRGMPLTWLSCGLANVESLEPLRGMKLTQLYCEGNRVKDLEPLRGMPLAELIIPGNRIRDLVPLRGMPLTNLNIGNNEVEDLSVLAEIPISTLRCPANRIDSLEPLRHMALNFLLCGGNGLTSLEPLREKPPTIFSFACSTLPTTELERVREYWINQPGLERYAAEVEVILAAQEHDVARLRELGQEFNGHHYLYIPIPMEWDAARRWCEEHDGHLVTITSPQENAYILSMFPWGSWFWLGLFTNDSGHHWVTGESFEFKTYCHVLDEKAHCPKVFSAGNWRKDAIPNGWNPFVIEWDQ